MSVEAQIVSVQLRNQAVELLDAYERVAATLATFDIERLWSLATMAERKTLVDELVEAVHIYPDHLMVKVHGAPELNVLLSEVGLRQSATSGVGDPTRT